MAPWTAVARLVSEQEDAELLGMSVESDVSDGDRPRPRLRWTKPTIMLGAACGLLAALGAAAAFYAPWTSSARKFQGGGVDDAHVTVLTDDEVEARAGPAMLHVADLDTFQSKATAGASCPIPCGSGDGTWSSVLAGLLDETTDSMPPGSDPSCGDAQELVKQQCPLCNCCGDMCAVTSGILLGGTNGLNCANSYEVPIDLFDLNMSHPDFEQPFVSGLCRGLVDKHLAPDFTPVLSANAGSLSGNCARAIKDQNSFNDWYHDTAKSFPESGTLKLCQNPNTGYYEYENDAYFTMDGRGWDERKQGAPDHNYHFTMHLNNHFTMQGGENFTFQGDDDVWVFFSKCDKASGVCEPSKLGIDLGGVHTVEKQTVNLEQLGFKPGDYVRMDFFWAERHTTESNLKIVTNINFDTETTTTSRTSTSRTVTSRTSTTRTSKTKTTTSGTTTTNTDTHTTLTNTVTTTTATTTTATTTTVTTTTTATTTSVTTTSITATTTTATTITATTTTPSPTAPIPLPTTSILPTTPNPCEAGCDGSTCAEKFVEIINESGEGSSPPMTPPEAVLVLLKMCPNCESCDPSGICPEIAAIR